MVFGKTNKNHIVTRNIIVYIAGLYSTGDVDINIQTARQVAIKVWEAGFTAICPHLNTAHFEKDCKCKYEDYIEGDLEIVKRCDCLLMLPAWRESKGAKKEYLWACENQMPVFEKIESLKEYYDYWE